MKVLKFLFLFSTLVFVSSSISAQNKGEEITFNKESGNYIIKYWSEIDDTFHKVTLFVGDQVKPVISSNVIFKDQLKFEYNYQILNKVDAKRSLYSFSIGTNASISNINSPSKLWYGRYIGWKKTIKWAKTGGVEIGISPGDKLTGFSFQSSALPSIVKSKSSSYTSISYPDEGPTSDIWTKIDSIRNTKSHVVKFTIGPSKLSDDVSNLDLVDTLRSYLAFSCDTTWVTNKGICRSLQAKLDNVEKHLSKDKTKQAINVLNAFLNEVAAQRGKHITSEGYALLWFNGLHLLEQLGGERPGKGGGKDKGDKKGGGKGNKGNG